MPKTSRAGSGCNDCSCKPSSQDIPARTAAHAQPAAGKRGFLQDLLAAAMAAVALPVAAAAPGTPGFQPPRRPGEAGRRYGMLVDLRRCIGCQACTVSCSMENLPPLGQFRTTVLQYEVQHAGNEDLPPAMLNLPRLCNHCDNPPCVRVCPTKATFKREDGIVMMDMHRCIGCRFCMAGCPYGSRSFNFQDPRPFIAEENPVYPTRMKGVVEKCTFCTERLAEGKMPACVEASEGKIVFGDLGDPDSEIRHILAENFTLRRKPDLGTSPSVFYII